MPRFGDRPREAPPSPLPAAEVAVSVERNPVATIDAADLAALGPGPHLADFHCVSTWSVTGLTWTGVPLRDVIASLGLDEPLPGYVVARGADRCRRHFVTEDALAPDVLLATHLDGVVLGPRHGGPLRLVAPRQYGYKSVKHVVSLDFRHEAPTRLGKEHLRGRVALEERHPTLPSRLLRGPYRLLVPLTAALADRSLRRPGEPSGRS
jgi:DMSO/TMAO reductase YedYZ molybdopterin-dependent catalytic subunit